MAGYNYTCNYEKSTLTARETDKNLPQKKQNAYVFYGFCSTKIGHFQPKLLRELVEAGYLNPVFI